jgi:hypothetical protein
MPQLGDRQPDLDRQVAQRGPVGKAHAAGVEHQHRLDQAVEQRLRQHGRGPWRGGGAGCKGCEDRAGSS